MEILFKDDSSFYYIENDILGSSFIKSNPSIDLSNIPHLDDVEVLYHYIDIDSKFRYPVYYEHKSVFISKTYSVYTWYYILRRYIKDYTLVNLKLL